MTWGGYFGYGFKDKDWKYGVSLELHLDEKKDLIFTAEYSNDAVEPGRTKFVQSRYLNNDDFIRNFLIQRMNKVERMRAELGFRTLRYLVVGTHLERDNIVITNDYQYAVQGDDVDVLLNEFK